MTMYKPTLEIKKLIVTARGESVFSADFHSGLNVIRGENSSGKSTIMDFLFYALGGILMNGVRQRLIAMRRPWKFS